MGIFSWIILGLIAGILAKWIMPGKDPGGFIVTTLIGIAGAFVGGFLGSLVGIGGPVSEISIGSIITAVIGALVLLFIYRKVKG
ncbi:MULTISPECIES: GlsB/YeaQ/YmgE family stress response membrane protein [Halomonas]|uniref:GlsB/YeaQ/YmgE family stress response membrane protein n=1 Tax=Halomonas binhaiensis TaxID=2562282 RepID=A0A5C1NH60_9GAMM|nr:MULTISPECIES: GlsB/YeaQ/YmgE family stress response membrane protein [Halomonas]QEM81993.1 GlsB/YeaQ/YmgE family stress response membrane protein [Halomonas binhaiensis]